MRSNLTIKTILAVVAILLTVSLSAMAQQGQGQGQRGQRGQGGDRSAQQLERMTTQLGLSDTQKKQLTPILQAQGKKMRAVFQDENLSQEQRREKMGKIREETNAQIKKILTPEQQKKWEAYLKERESQRGQRGGRRGGGGGGNE